MAQEFTISDVSSNPPREWDSKYGPMETYKVLLEGHGEIPVSVNRKPGNKPKVGDKLYGDIKRTEFGDQFKAAQKPFGGYKGQSKDDSAIRAQWAIGQSIQLLGLKYGKDLLNSDRPGKDLELVETFAKEFYAMVDRVKGSSESTKITYPVYQSDDNGKVTQVATETVELPKQPVREWESLGKAKISAEDAETMDDSEFLSLVQSAEDQA